MSNTDFGYGFQVPEDANSDLTSAAFMVRKLISQLDTMKLVQVVTVHGGEGAIAAAGTVDVLPLVNQIDGASPPNSVKHAVVYGIPWSRVQGGKNAVICDPQVDDIGYVVCSDRDISNVVSTQAQANPGSFRRYNIADGVYAGGCLNVAPNQYLVFTAQGVRLVDANGNSVTMAAAGTTVTDKNNNTIVMAAAGITVTDKNNNTIVMSSAGISATDKNSNSIVMASGGVTVTDDHGNVLAMASGGITITGNVTVVGTLTATKLETGEMGLAVTGAITATGEITRGFGTGDSVTLGQHTHTQAVDSHGDTEAPTAAPTPGT